jgi:hypothetical protein
MISGLPIQHDPLASCQACWWKKPCCGEAAPLTRIRHGYASAGNHAPARELRLLVEELRCSSDLFFGVLCALAVNQFPHFSRDTIALSVT